MKYGMPTLVECADIYECIEVAKKYDLDFIEINTSFPQYQATAMNTEELCTLARENGLFYTIHADEQLNPFDFKAEVSECYFGEMREHIRFALAIGAPVINMHLLKGVYVTLPGRVILLTDVYKDEYMAKVRAFIRLCEEEIGDAPLRICIENVDSNPFTSSQREALELFLASRVFGMTYDTGHDKCLGGKDRDIYDTYRNKLSHMHLHDSNGRSAHLPLGSADIDVPLMLDMIEGRGACLVEVKTIAGLAESVEYLKSIGRFERK
ncbi:MAG: sugar phosphate isomerase/epimerase [Clostridia bacterium]|nr:sugar phosphate isomerase/epimerase [Clostridia bacterium]